MTYCRNMSDLAAGEKGVPKLIAPSLCEKWLEVVETRHTEHGEAWDVMDEADFASVIFMKASRLKNQARMGNLDGLLETLCDLHNYAVKLGQKVMEKRSHA